MFADFFAELFQLAKWKRKLHDCQKIKRTTMIFKACENIAVLKHMFNITYGIFEKHESSFGLRFQTDCFHVNVLESFSCHLSSIFFWSWSFKYACRWFKVWPFEKWMSMHIWNVDQEQIKQTIYIFHNQNTFLTKTISEVKVSYDPRWFRMVSLWHFFMSFFHWSFESNGG